MPEQTAVYIEVDGQRMKMPVNWKAYQGITQEVGDPFRLVRQYESGDDSWLTIASAVSIIRIGLEAGGHKYSDEQLGDEILSSGLSGYLTVVGEYITSFVTGGGAIPESDAKEGDAPTGKSKPRAS